MFLQDKFLQQVLLEANIPNGDYAKDVCFNTQWLLLLERFRWEIPHGTFPGASVKRILGRHAWGSVVQLVSLLKDAVIN
jgi:hypothetical protein